MKHHTIVCRLGDGDKTLVKPSRPDSNVTQISFIKSKSRLEFGLGQAIDQLGKLGLAPSETAIDLAILAALLTAADTRISRAKDSQDNWTREIDLYVPVADPARWASAQGLLVTILDFLTGDRWGVYFRPRISSVKTLAIPPHQLRIANPSCVCLFSGGLDSFIGAADLFAGGETPLLVSHYWDGVTSTHQTHCAEALRKEFKGKRIDNIRAHVGFPNATVKGSESDNTLRGRSFMFFALAALAADAVGGEMRIHVPENGFISLNVPLDPLRLGSLSTRTTHPFYMARFNELLQKLGIKAELENRYRHMTKGAMITLAKSKAFIAREAKNTMSCSAPTKYRFHKDKNRRKQQHCGHCVPCLIRRAAMHKGLAKDDTPYAIPDLKARVLDTNRAEGDHVRSFQFALSRLNKNPKRAVLDIHRPGPLTDHPTDWKAYEQVYVDGLHEVGALLTGVRARPQ
jgi:7-cyano-7-deazaguanine synthase in queuosine biosynthesis